MYMAMLVRLGKHKVIVRVLPRSCTINNKKMSQESTSEKVYRCINNLYVWFSELCATWDACDDKVSIFSQTIIGMN